MEEIRRSLVLVIIAGTAIKQASSVGPHPQGLITGMSRLDAHYLRCLYLNSANDGASAKVSPFHALTVLAEND